MHRDAPYHLNPAKHFLPDWVLKHYAGIWSSYELMCVDFFTHTDTHFRKETFNSKYIERNKPLSHPLVSSHCSCSLMCVLFSLLASLLACHSRGSTAKVDAHQVTVSNSYLLHADRSISCWDAPPWGLKFMEQVQAFTRFKWRQSWHTLCLFVILYQGRTTFFFTGPWLG